MLRKPIKHALLFLVGFVVISAFSTKTLELENTEQQELKLPIQIIDTIPEKTTVKHLDMGQNQLFIDTSRNSAFQHRALNWQPNKLFNQLVEM